jgi:stage V sporulation protein B
MALSTVVKQLAFRSIIVFVVKIIGALVRFPLFRWLGPDGVGLYQIIYSVYGLVLTFITGGFPTAITLTTAKDRQQGLRMLKAAIILLAVFGGLAGFIFQKFAYEFAVLLGDSRLEWSLRFIAPAILIVPILSLVRGYLQGIEYYSVIALSELIEQVFRVLTIVLFVLLWMRQSVGLAVGGAVLGAIAGALFALLFLYIMLNIYLRRLDPSKKLLSLQTGKITLFTFIILFRASVALSASRFIMPLADFLDAIIIPHRLQHAGFTRENATAVYGIFTGMAVSVVYMPTFISSAVSHIFSAKITSDWKKTNYVQFKRRSQIILQRWWLWGLGCSLYFFNYHAQLSQMLFGNASASKAILLLCAAPLISGMRELSTTILWACEKTKEPVVGLVMGLIIASSLGYVFIGQSSFSYEGIAMDLLALELVALLWNMHVLQRFRLQLFSFARLGFETVQVSFIAMISSFLGGFIVSAMHLSLKVGTYFEMAFSFIVIFSYILIRFLLLKNDIASKLD